MAFLLAEMIRSPRAERRATEARAGMPAPRSAQRRFSIPLPYQRFPVLSIKADLAIVRRLKHR